MTLLAEPHAPTGTRRLLAAPGPSWSQHLATFGPLPTGVDLAAAIESAGLAGRGGAGFPSARKLRGVAARGRGVVVGNGAEGEPLSDKDRRLLLAAPHLVLDGLLLAAAAVRAREAYLVTARSDVARHLREQVALRRDRVRIQVVEVADRFVAGEESALVNALNGRAGVPSDRSVRVYERGVRRRPTLVHNVETLAHMALLARYGPAWFRSVGTADEAGTFLATVTGAVGSPGVLEVPFGAPLDRLLEQVGGPAHYPQAVLVGGYHGAWVPGHLVGVDPDDPLVAGRPTARPSAPAWSPCWAATAAAWSRAPAWRRTSRTRWRGSAAPASTGCRGWRTRCTARPPRADAGPRRRGRPDATAGRRPGRVRAPRRHRPVRGQHDARLRGRGRRPPGRWLRCRGCTLTGPAATATGCAPTCCPRC